MRQFLAVLALGALGSVASLASSTTCTNLNNNALTAISTCTWTTNDAAVLTFSNFTLFNNNGSGTVNTTLSTWDLSFHDLGNQFQISYVPHPTAITADSITNGAGGVYQFLLSYQVQETTPGSGGNGRISSIAGNLNSTGVTGNGSVQFVKSFTNGGNISLLNSGGSSNLTGSSTAGLPSAGPITIFDSVNVNGGNNGASSATLVSFENDFFVTTGVPEPVTMSLVGAGLVGLGFLRRRTSGR